LITSWRDRALTWDHGPPVGSDVASPQKYLSWQSRAMATADTPEPIQDWTDDDVIEIVTQHR
jgi:hypothetical protein